MTLSTGALLVFLLIAVALVLFVTELLPPDITAIGVLVSLSVFEPYTGVPAADALSGFASPAVVTIIGMYVLSGAVEEVGVVAWLGARLAALTGGDERRLLGATVGSTGVVAGIVNNTPVVAVFIPMISDLANDAGISPSKFLIPLSFAAMLGGTLTLVGSSLNLLASDVSAQLLAHPIGMFEISALGVVVLLTGMGYLLTVGYRLTPARVPVRREFTAAYDLDRHLAKASVREESPLVGQTPTELFLSATHSLDVDVLQVERERPAETDNGATETAVEIETFIAGTDRPIAAGDILTLRGNRQAINQLATEFDLRQHPREAVEDADLETTEHRGMLAEVVLPPSSGLIDQTATEAQLLERYDTTVLAVRRGMEIMRDDVPTIEFRSGDTLLLQTTESAVEFLREEGDVILTDSSDESSELATADDAPPSLTWRAPYAVAVLIGVVLVAALTPVAIPVAALGGVVAVVAGGCVTPADAYDAVSWNVIFLLAGVLPLGIALQETGGAAAVGDALAGAGAVLPAVAMLGFVYLFASVLAAIVTPVATVVLLTPIAIDLARTLDVNGFAFVLATLFGASAAYLTPIGYQTNLMVYGPGAYRFTDFARVGTPLLVLLTIVTTAGIVGIYGL